MILLINGQSNSNFHKTPPTTPTFLMTQDSPANHLNDSNNVNTANNENPESTTATTTDISPKPTPFLQSHARHEQLSREIEVLLHASEAPMTDFQLKKHLSLTGSELEIALTILQQRLAQGVLVLNKTASGYRLQVADHYSSLIQRVFPQRLERMSQAMLETLSVIAYKQPVTRSDIEQVRGVTVSSNILRQLFDKGWIVEKGYRDSLGRPALLHTTDEFLDAFGLSHLDELPPLPDLESLADT